LIAEVPHGDASDSKAASECGVVGITNGLIASQAPPFSGDKEAGYGREGLRHGLDDDMDLKYPCQIGLGRKGPKRHNHPGVA
jgi:acyl-CoA reductase-like NAD-dependent aldehyde dehydrogenase